MSLLIQAECSKQQSSIWPIAYDTKQFYKSAGQRCFMLRVESEQEEDGRWIAEVPALPGVLAYGETKAEADAKVKALALRVIADRLDNGEQLPRELAGVFEAA
jgi:predicted RNase H-like HicB family nuclease